jgi:malic enzyme
MKRIYILLMVLSSLATIQSVHTASNTTEWVVVGAGPAGIATVGVLLDLGIDPQGIVWLDPEFNVGRMGAYYQNVPGNSRVAEFVSGT